ncbi:MAG: DUF2299 family protein [Candidatus Bathyarchaeia archaeon]
MSAETREQIIAHVMKWITQSGLEVTSFDDARHDFVLAVSETVNLPQLQVIHLKPDSAFVMIVGLVNIPESDRQTLKNRNADEFDTLVWDIKLNLVRMGVDFTVLGAERDPDSWEVQKRLMLSDTTANDFLEAYSKAKNALISIIWSYKRALEKTT